jgi:hypothetical protein
MGAPGGSAQIFPWMEQFEARQLDGVYGDINHA